jgi:carboxyl-terminal processing protease
VLRLRFLPSLLLLATFLASVSLAGEPERRVLGDLPPAAVDLETLLTADLEGSEARELFERVQSLLLERIGTDVLSDTDLYLGAIQGMVDVANRRQAAGASPTRAALPPSGMVLKRSDADQLLTALEGRITGVGIEFQLYSRPGIIVVSRVLPGSPAEAAGLVVDDRIIAIDGQGFAGLGLPEVLTLLQGEQGSRMEVQFQRGFGLGSASYAVALERRSFEVRSAVDELRPNGVGYVRVFQFHRGTPTEVEESLARLVELGADRFVLDLRDSAGGDILAAVGVADLFVPEGTVLTRLVEPGVGEQDLVAHKPQATDANLVLLVNSWTHGAAEAIAAALQEHHRAYVIGEPTMGSGRTETLVDLGHGFVLRLDSVRMQSPLGRSWEGRGVVPDQPFWTSTGTDQERAEGAPDALYEMAVHFLETEGF